MSFNPTVPVVQQVPKEGLLSQSSDGLQADLSKCHHPANTGDFFSICLQKASAPFRLLHSLVVALTCLSPLCHVFGSCKLAITCISFIYIVI
jgi:hypothetical protein